jgi:hypothetical protein
MNYQRHPLDIGSLVFGLVFLGGVAVWGLFELDVLAADDTAWLLPGVLIAAGLVGTALAATKGRRDRQEHAGTAHSTETTDTQTLPQERHDD